MCRLFSTVQTVNRHPEAQVNRWRHVQAIWPERLCTRAHASCQQAAGHASRHAVQVTQVTGLSVLETFMLVACHRISRQSRDVIAVRSLSCMLSIQSLRRGPHHL